MPDRPSEVAGATLVAEEDRENGEQPATTVVAGPEEIPVRLKDGSEALHESEARLRAILEYAPMSMAIVGMDGTIEYINRKAQVTFGYSPADIPTMDHWWLLAYPAATYRSEVIATWSSISCWR